ncbi:hypothetical protein M5689_003235 [Euphorbia peplus]|nr:hypothetical protein M5689_003235 [Euphorbia peplus]
MYTSILSNLLHPHFLIAGSQINRLSSRNGSGGGGISRRPTGGGAVRPRSRNDLGDTNVAAVAASLSAELADEIRGKFQLY